MVWVKHQKLDAGEHQNTKSSIQRQYPKGNVRHRTKPAKWFGNRRNWQGGGRGPSFSLFCFSRLALGHILLFQYYFHQHLIAAFLLIQQKK